MNNIRFLLLFTMLLSSANSFTGCGGDREITCDPGYQDYGDGSCKPSDPCSLDTVCAEQNRGCENNQGVAECGECLNGYHVEGEDCVLDSVCTDEDGDGHDVYEETTCPGGDDYCDTDPSNWSYNGCENCVDADGDGYGTDCDLGTDCYDADNTIWTGCPGCTDADGDGHDALDATYCPSGDDNCDGDTSNWTRNGCDNCVDIDGDGYGTDCDLGSDCDDSDNTIWTGCIVCTDMDADGHYGYNETYCPSGDDYCDEDPNKTDGDVCGCGIPDEDTDEDGLLDCMDNCPGAPNADQLDGDADDRGDECDNCPSVSNTDQVDTDDDEIGDVCDNCIISGNPEQLDTDSDGAGDVCDPCPLDALDDEDQDGACADVDNCAGLANPDQADSDLDGAGDLCDPCPNDPLDDQDADGVCGDVDNCPADANADQADADSDGAGDVCDPCPDHACEGPCAVCGSGTCTMPVDDVNCVVDCDQLDHTCRDYHDLAVDRCLAIGQCKTSNDLAYCTDFTDAPATLGCGFCQRCDGAGSCEPVNCVTTSFKIYSGNCNSACQDAGLNGVCLDMGLNGSAASDNQYYVYYPDEHVCRPPSGGTCATAVPHAACGHWCLCRYEVP